MENQSQSLLNANPAIRQTRENYNSWSFTQSKERSFVRSIEAIVTADIFGIKNRVTEGLQKTQMLRQM